MMTSATEVLRRMLDERGVEWSTNETLTDCWTRWNAGKFRCTATEINGTFAFTVGRTTPEQAVAATLGTPVTGETSDGYHTFNELYHHRAVLFSVIVRDHIDSAWKSKAHHDGTMYDGMFIVGIETPEGQATYHYDIDPYWDMFDCKELDRAPEWDGHTPDDAIERIATMGNEESYTRDDVESAFVSGYSLGSLPVGSDPQWDQNEQTVDEHMAELGWVRAATLGRPAWRNSYDQQRYDRWYNSLFHGEPSSFHELIEDVIWTTETVDLGPNGNECQGVDEGEVYTERLIESWAKLAATLGCRECELHDCEGSFSALNRPVWRCDCGAFMTQYTDATTYHKPRFCPNCGKAVKR